MTVKDREHIVRVPQPDIAAMQRWLADPNGFLSVGPGVVFESVEDGSIWVRTRPWGGYGERL